MAIESYYYNHYNLKGTYTCETPEIPAWKEEYAVTINEISSNNKRQNSDAYKAYCKLEETYYNLSVANREKYDTKDELVAALSKKY